MTIVHKTVSARSAFITGVTSGIGEALCHELAGRGYWLALTARKREALDQLAQALRDKHPQIRLSLHLLDVCDDGAVANAVNGAALALEGLDIVIANAGVGSGQRAGSGGFEQDRMVIETNLIGAMATLNAGLTLFRRQGRGQLVAISSVAAFRGLPGSASYSASKAGIAVYADALRAEVHGTPIHVTTLFPGYIDTPLNQRIKNRPFLIPVNRGTRIIADMIERRVNESTVPVFPWTLMKHLLRLLPTSRIAGMGMQRDERPA